MMISKDCEWLSVMDFLIVVVSKRSARGKSIRHEQRVDAVRKTLSLYIKLRKNA